VDKSLTIALPIHNGETYLRRCVRELLELASELTADFSVLIIDDGSTDDTYELAQELALRYPQISVNRSRVRRGLGPTLESIQRRVSSDVVMVHDGTTPIDPQQIRRLWRTSATTPWAISGGAQTHVDPTRWDEGELAELPAIHAAMASAHQRLLGFHLLRPMRWDDAHAAVSTPPAPSRAQHMRPTRSADLGRIPPLPRPKFLSALAEFALGE
jgi:Glycosyl transferase family 2